MNICPGEAMTTVTVEKIRTNPKPGSTRAFVTFKAHGIRICDARIVDGSKGTLLALPQKSWETNQGETRYSPIIEIEDTALGQRSRARCWKHGGVGNEPCCR